MRTTRGSSWVWGAIALLGVGVLPAQADQEALKSGIERISKLKQQLEGAGSECVGSPIEKSASSGASSEACVPTEKHSQCRVNKKGQVFRCDRSTLSKKTRARLQGLLLEAVNRQNEINRAEGKLEIHPAAIMSFVAAESSGDPLQERSDGGKGLGQFTFPDVAARYGLDYRSPKPQSLEEAFRLDHPLRTDSGGEPIYSVWSPKGSLIAMAKKLSQHLNAEHYIAGVDAQGRKVRREASVIYKGSDVHATRYIAGIYNRGSMVFNSVQEYYRQRGVLPSRLEFGLDYGSVWEARRIQGETPSKNFQILNKECINRCHVEKIAGLCGDEPQGFFAAYSQDYVRRGTQWALKA